MNFYIEVIDIGVGVGFKMKSSEPGKPTTAQLIKLVNDLDILRGDLLRIANSDSAEQTVSKINEEQFDSLLSSIKATKKASDKNVN